MTKREWIQAVLDGERTVPVPQHWMGFFNGETARRLTPRTCHYDPMWLYDLPNRFDSGPHACAALEHLIALNNHTGRCFACLGKGANVAFGHGGPGEFYARVLEHTDQGLVAEYETGAKVTVQFAPHFTHSFDHPVRSLEDVKRLALPDPEDADRYRGLAEDAAFLRERGEYVLASLNGFFSGIHYFLMEYTETLMALAADPALIERILERLGPWNLAAAGKMIEAGADCIALCDDLGSKQNMLMSPELYRRYFKPWHRRLCDTVHELGGRVHLHTHGAVTPILDDLVECGFDFINPFDPEEGFRLDEVMACYADLFVVVGGFPTSFWSWDAARQDAHLAYMGQLGSRFGRLVFMDSGGIPESLTRQDFDRVLEMSRRARRVDSLEGAV